MSSQGVHLSCDLAVGYNCSSCPRDSGDRDVGCRDFSWDNCNSVARRPRAFGLRCGKRVPLVLRIADGLAPGRTLKWLYLIVFSFFGARLCIQIKAPEQSMKR